MIFVLMGAPGAGKGSQADRLVEEEGFFKISTGDALRKHIKSLTDVGKEAAGFVNEGKLVPDETLLKVLKEEIELAQGKPILLDGYPRNVAQAESLEGLNLDLKGVLHLDVDHGELVQRLSGRRVCSNCGATYHSKFKPTKVDGICDRCGGAVILRSDDAPEKVEVRLKVYEDSTKPVLDFYRSKGVLTSLSGEGTEGEISERIKGVIDAKRN